MIVGSNQTVDGGIERVQISLLSRIRSATAMGKANLGERRSDSPCSSWRAHQAALGT